MDGSVVFARTLCQCAPYLIHASLGPPESTTETASGSLQPFLQGSLLWQTDWQTTLLGR